MGFRSGSYAKVWRFEDKGNYAIVEISTSKKNKQTDQYETDFNSKFARFIGKAHTDILTLQDGVKIKLGEIEVTNSWNKETKQGYTNFLVYTFEVAERQDSESAGSNAGNQQASGSDGFLSVPDTDLEELPFS